MRNLCFMRMIILKNKNELDRTRNGHAIRDIKFRIKIFLVHFYLEQSDRDKCETILLFR